MKTSNAFRGGLCEIEMRTGSVRFVRLGRMDTNEMKIRIYWTWVEQNFVLTISDDKLFGWLAFVLFEFLRYTYLDHAQL